jgi:antitoxin (DNA-binding transcriptional repressor) of toxin-antitoxin stability system
MEDKCEADFGGKLVISSQSVGNQFGEELPSRDQLLILSSSKSAHFGSTSVLFHRQLQLKVGLMKTVTMLQFRKNAEGILRRIQQGERFVLSHRGQPVARLEPLGLRGPADPANDPFLAIAARAQPSPKGKTKHSDIDQIVYGGR